MSNTKVPDSRISRKIAVSPQRAKSNVELLKKAASDVATSEINGFASLVSYSPTSERPVHRWFRYREGYSLDLVKEIIKDLPKGSIILDPFCGCGSTLLAAQELGFDSYGFDVNPLSTLVSKVKTRNYSEKLQEQLSMLRKGLRKLDLQDPSDEPPKLEIISKVFDKDILKILLIQRRYINAIVTDELKDFILVGWLAILEDVSNVYKEGNGIKYRNRKRLPTGYITVSDKDWQTFPDDKTKFVIEKLDKQLSMMMEDLKARTTQAPIARVIEDSAEVITRHLIDGEVACAVFSPPYCNCFNYFKAFKVELWMGGFVNSYKELRTLNRRGLRSHVETPLKRETDIAIPLVEEFLELLDPKQLWDKRIPDAVRGYFVDMKNVLRELYKTLRPSGKCVIVVGNSAYSGIVIPTDSLLCQLAKEEGFVIERMSVARHLTTSSQQRLALADRQEFLRESLIFLRKPDPRLADHELTVTNEIPNNRQDRDGKVFVIKNSGLTSLTHKFHRYPGKFIPHIPRWAIKKHFPQEQGKVILDPFCGSGTTLVEAILAGQKAIGLDIDPLGCLVTKVKTTQINQDRLYEVVNEVAIAVAERSKGKFRPKVENLEHWFTTNAITELSLIRDVIEKYKRDTEIYQFLLVCFVSVIRRASNADNQTQKTYVSHTKVKTPESAKKLFLVTLKDYAIRLSEFSAQMPAHAQSYLLPLSDARCVGETWKTNNLPLVDLIVTSPPYLKSVDYVYNQMAEYFWVGDLFGLNTRAQQNDYKRHYVGSENVIKSEYTNLPTLGIKSVDSISRTIYTKDPKHGYIVAKFFLDMVEHFKQVRQIMRKDAHYVMVIGDSLVSNESIPVHELVQDCAKSAGFGVDEVFGYEIRNRHMRFPRMGRGGIVRYDWVIDFMLEHRICKTNSIGGMLATAS